MKKYAFIRCSTKEQEPHLQLRDIGTMIPVEQLVVIEENISAFKKNVKRLEFEKLYKLIKAKAVDELYVWHLDRLFRSRKGLVEFLSFCKIYKVKVFSYNQRWLETINEMPVPFNEIMFDLFLQIIGWIAESESETKSNRVQLAVRKTDNGTYSCKGKKWGRKPLPPQTINRVLEHRKEGKSIREIAAIVMVYDKNNNGRNIAVLTVHKILTENPQ